MWPTQIQLSSVVSMSFAGQGGFHFVSLELWDFMVGISSTGFGSQQSNIWKYFKRPNKCRSCGP